MFESLSGLLAKITLSLFLLLLFCAGILIGGTAFHDPDSCWLVALGKVIVEHGAIPTIEPFSYTFADLHRPLVLYQWLTEAFFYLAVKFGGLTSLLALIAALVMTAFVVMPLRVYAMARARWSVALVLIGLSLISGAFHFLARPEILSYFFLSILLYLLTTHRLALAGVEPENKQPLNLRMVAGVTLIMVAWSNCHTGFTSGLAVLAVYLLADLVSRLSFRIRPFCDFAVLLSLVSGSLGTLCNPYGVRLWQYIPSLFFARFNSMIMELHAVDVKKPEFVPFILFVILFVVCWVTRFQKHRQSLVSGASGASTTSGANSKNAAQLLNSTMIFAVCVFEGWTHLRLIPFVVLILLDELALLLSPISASPAHASPILENQVLAMFDKKLDQGLAPPFKLGGLGNALLVLAIGVGGTLLTCISIQHPVLPQSGGVFSLPVEAMNLVSSSKIDGRILNDPQFGDALIWYHPDQPKVFIDTRFDMYGESLVHDYLCMTDVGGGWQQTMDKYNIKTVFLLPSSKLVKQLEANPQWHVEYMDKKAAVLSRP